MAAAETANPVAELDDGEQADAATGDGDDLPPGSETEQERQRKSLAESIATKVMLLGGASCFVLFMAVVLARRSLGPAMPSGVRPMASA